nr:ArsA family ATPase [Rhodococcus sp. 14-2470-1a]
MTEARSDARTAVRLFVGKGGAGKTTFALKSAVDDVRAGSRALVVSFDQAHSVTDVLGVNNGRAGGAEPAAVEPGLDVLELDTLALVATKYAALTSILSMAGAGHEHGVRFGAVDPEEIIGAPGVQELVGLDRLVDLIDQSRWDTVFVDLPATADALRILQLPDLVAGYLERLWPRHDRIVAGTGTDPRLTLVVAMLENIVTAAERIRELFLDHSRTSMTVVLTPDRVGVAEARRTLSAAALTGLAVDTIVVNKVLPLLNSSSIGLVGAHPAVFWFEGWRSAQQEVLGEVSDLAAGTAVVVVEQASQEPVGLVSLAALDTQRTTDTTDERPGTDTPTVAHESGTGLESIYAMTMVLPLVDPSTLTLGRVDDDVIIGADGVRRRVRLASVLRRCIVLGAEFDAGRLVIRFRPDPAVWPA